MLWLAANAPVFNAHAGRVPLQQADSGNDGRKHWLGDQELSVRWWSYTVDEEI